MEWVNGKKCPKIISAKDNFFSFSSFFFWAGSILPFVFTNTFKSFVPYTLVSKTISSNGCMHVQRLWGNTWRFQLSSKFLLRKSFQDYKLLVKWSENN